MVDSSLDVLDVEQFAYDEKEDAFLAWVRLGRSSRKTAEETQIPHGTIKDWVTRYGWRERYKGILDELTYESVASTRLSLSHTLHTAAQRLLTDLAKEDLPPHDVRLHIDTLVRLVTGGQVSTQAGAAVTHIDARQVHIKPEDINPQDARTLATQAIEKNLKDNEVRRKPRGTWG
jgi:transposase